MLQDCFDNTDWGVFAVEAELDEYACSVLGHINFSTEKVTNKEQLKCFPIRSHGSMQM